MLEEEGFEPSVPLVSRGGVAGAGSSTFLSTSALPKIALALRTPTGELSDDRSVELADPKWPQGAHCARRARPRIQGDPGQYWRRRPVQVGVPEDHCKPPHSGDRRHRRPRRQAV